ncbi:hypothetical protein [Kitasatospora sp. NBC_01302]|uniref:hypothetical protein n=1 Tax=Kitasatospora sp. NBC_01302 TaxID=2903575 RepID=UPI003FA39DF0
MPGSQEWCSAYDFGSSHGQKTCPTPGRRHRHARGRDAGYLWAFATLTTSPGAKAHHRRRRDDASAWHACAQRNLFNRMLGQLYHCLKNRRLFDELVTFPDLQGPVEAVAWTLEEAVLTRASWLSLVSGTLRPCVLIDMLSGGPSI